MADFLDVAHDLWKGEERLVPSEPFGIVFEGISRLQRVHSKAQLDIKNVESVFAAFEMAKTLGTYSDYTTDKIEELIDATRAVILHTLDASIRLPVDGKTVLAPPPYREFAELVGKLRSATHRRRSVAVITFNYDVAVDFACYQKHIGVDYALGEPKRPPGGLPLLKLHGSLNWAYCAECDSVVPWTLPEYCAKHSWNLPLHVHDVREVSMNMGANVKEFKHCDKKVETAPLIVPPTWNKTEYHKDLAPVWARAAKELSDAEDLFIIGYSLPESDFFFRYLFALGTVGKSPLRRVWVFNPDQTGDIKNRFREFLGPGAEQRFEYYAATFEQAIPVVTDAYQLPR